MLPLILRLAVMINGVFDVTCALLALYSPDSFLAKLHTGMFIREQDRDNKLLRRVMAYWLLCYGATRITFWFPGGSCPPLVAWSYYLKASAFWTEDMVYATTHEWKVVLVSWSSAIMGTCVLFMYSFGL